MAEKQEDEEKGDDEVAGGGELRDPTYAVDHR